MASTPILNYTNKQLGWIPDIPDARDYKYTAPRGILKALPPKMDLRTRCPEIYDQGTLCACTANAISATIEVEQGKQGIKAFTPSRLFIYYNERRLQHSAASDAKCGLRNAIKTVVSQGVCSEACWPYEADRFTRKPSPKCYAEGIKHTINSYQRISQSLNKLKACIGEGSPFVFGFCVYDSFMSDATTQSGHMQLPNMNKERMLGGHAVMAVGYDELKKWFIIRNSWGNSWGIKGYFTMPYDLILNKALCSDFWTIRMAKRA